MSPPVHNPWRVPFLLYAAALDLGMLLTMASLNAQPGPAQIGLTWAGCMLTIWYAVRLSMIMAKADAMPTEPPRGSPER